MNGYFELLELDANGGKINFFLFQEKKAAFSFCFLVGCDICRGLTTIFYLYKPNGTSMGKFG